MSLIRELIIIDQTPLLIEAQSQCERACRAIDEAKAELHRFEVTDLPAYNLWYNSIFGLQLTAIREASAIALSKEQELALARKRHWDRFFGSCQPTAYEESTLGRESGRARADLFDDDGSDEELRADERHEARARSNAAFSDFGADEEGEDGLYDEDDAFYHDDELESHYGEDAESVRRFEDAFLRGGRQSGAYRARGRGEDDERFGRRTSASGARIDGVETRAQNPSQDEVSILQRRIKERYRTLVRKLHPDLNPSLTDEQRGLWAQVQTAYQAQNLEQLDLLTALSDAFAGVTGSSGAGVGQLRRAALEIGRLLLPLRKKLEDARRSRAWNFSARIALEERESLHRELKQELSREISVLRERISQLDAQLERFSRTHGRAAGAERASVLSSAAQF